MPAQEIETKAREKLESELAEVYEPGPITDPNRFSGRVELLERCRSQLAKPGVSFAIYGARGLGKSSFANVLLARNKFLRRTAQHNMAFDRLFGPILKALNEGLVISQRTISDKETIKAGVDAKVLQAGGELSTEYSDSYMPVVQEVLDFDFVATALKKHADQLDTIVIEEFQRLPATTQRDVVQLMKVLCDQAIPVRIMIIGITEVGDQLTEDREYQEYIGRCITTVAMPRMTPDELRDIIDRRAVSGIRVSEDVADDLVWVASGYPALVHSVMFDAVLRWIGVHVAALVVSVIDLVSRVVGFFSAGAGKTIAVKRVELDKAGVNVGRKELESALRLYIAGFKSQELRGSSYERAATNEQAKAALDAYALADENGLEAEAAEALLREDLRPPAGLRPYLRAELLLAGDTRAGARGSAK